MIYVCLHLIFRLCVGLMHLIPDLNSATNAISKESYIRDINRTAFGKFTQKKKANTQCVPALKGFKGGPPPNICKPHSLVTTLVRHFFIAENRDRKYSILFMVRYINNMQSYSFLYQFFNFIVFLCIR